MQKPMTRTELKNFAAKMRRMITAAVQTQVEECLGGLLPQKQAEKLKATRDATVEEMSYIIFMVFTMARFMEALGLEPAKKVMSQGTFLVPFFLIRMLLPEMPRLSDVQIFAQPHSPEFWGDIRTEFRQLFCEENPDVRTLGWLHQFYHAEKKDEIIRGVKRGEKIIGNKIKIATQIFTPEWIAEFLVQNTLRTGGEWCVPPDTSVVEFWDEKPLVERTFCDPACGSGNMLLAAYDVFFEAYRADGMPEDEIPAKILSRNLYGMDIDPWMIALAAFSLRVKAWEHDPWIFARGIFPNLCVTSPPKGENFEWSPEAIIPWLGRFVLPTETCNVLMSDLKKVSENPAGTLLRPEFPDAEAVRLFELSKHIWPITESVADCLRACLKQIWFQNQKYDVIVTNPPYMGSRGMDAGLTNWLEKHYPEAKKDLFAAFVARNMEMVTPGGHLGFMTPFVWMFISSYKKLRKKILAKKTLTTLVQLEYSGFEDATVPICAFTLKNSPTAGYRGAYIRLSDFRGAEKQAPRALEAVRNPDCGWFYRANQADFLKIPGFPLAYWLSKAEFGVFENSHPLSKVAVARQGCATSDNARFLRLWHEVPFSEIAFDVPSRQAALASGKRWFPYNKGGAFRRWYGNQEYLIDWANDGDEIKSEVAQRYPYLGGNTNYVVKNQNYYFQESLSWSKITSSGFSLRYYPPGFVFDVSGCCIFHNADFADYQKPLLGCLNSPVMTRILNTLAPTLNFEVGQVAKFPLPDDFLRKTAESVPIIEKLIEKSKKDWQSFENSWNFQRNPIFEHFRAGELLRETFSRLLTHWRAETGEMRQMEEENNRIFLRAYGLEGVLPAEVPLREVTLRANPHYRYMQAEEIKNNTASQADLQRRLLYDTITEFISYAVGCFFGRYSPDAAGLVLAEDGQTASDFQKQVPHARFLPVADNVIITSENGTHPLDAARMLEQFMGTYFGAEHLAQNLAFFEEILGRSLASYFRARFFHDHNKSYKNRPIYWFFASPKKTFCAMIYAHRFTPDFFQRLREKYVTPLLHAKRSAYTEMVGTKGASRVVLERFKNQISELETYVAESLQPLEANGVKIDLNDGILANYAKMGSAVRKIS